MVVLRAAASLVLGLVVGSAAACGADSPAELPADEEPRPSTNGGGLDAGRDASGTDGSDASSSNDAVPPAAISDLAATSVGASRVVLGWSAPADDGPTGRAALYEIRWSKTAIANVADFEAATLASGPPTPQAPNAAESFTLAGLEPQTPYWVALRSRDDAANFSAISNVVTVTTKTRAELLLTEIAPVNDSGLRFVELVAVKAGSIAGYKVMSARATAPLYEFADLEVLEGDRLVVHLTGTPLPAGAVQEDATKSKTSSTAPRSSDAAYDVYASATAVTSTDNVVSVIDGTNVLDAVAFSDRSSTPAAAAMTAYAKARSDGSWAFTNAPVLGTTNCETQLEAVNASGLSAPACGGVPGLLTKGQSMQRDGSVDTNTRGEWFVAAETPGALNPPMPAPCPDLGGALLAITEVNPRASLVELHVTRGGLLRNYALRSNPRINPTDGKLTYTASFVTFPTICAQTGDLVVVHVGAGTSGKTETSAKDEHKAADNPGYYDDAWDVSGTTTTMPYGTSLVLGVRDANNVYLEAAPFSSQTVTATDTYNASLAYIQGLGLWMPANCGGEACTNTTTPTGRDLSASWNGVATTPAGDSCRRTSPTSDRTSASWSVGASSFGANN